MSLTLHRLFCITFALCTFVFCSYTPPNVFKASNVGNEHVSGHWQAEGGFLAGVSDQNSEFECYHTSHQTSHDWPWTSCINPNDSLLSETPSSTRQYQEGTSSNENIDHDECINLATNLFSKNKLSVLSSNKRKTFGNLFKAGSDTTSRDSWTKKTEHIPRIQVEENSPIELIPTESTKFIVRLRHQSTRSDKVDQSTTIAMNGSRFKYLMTAIDCLYELLRSHEAYSTLPQTVTSPTEWLDNVVFGNKFFGKRLPLLATIQIEDLPPHFKTLQIIKDFGDQSSGDRIGTIEKHYKSGIYQAELKILFGKAQLDTANFLRKSEKGMPDLPQVAVSLLAYWYDNVAWGPYGAPIHSFWKLMKETLAKRKAEIDGPIRRRQQKHS